ncbi:SprT-like domain-containing protein [Curtobacterium sp. MCBD17_040]|uniref:SprT-like domain-containing protein n=1 Tax=Curtobacterium sp. MCBD17_040 TaxID=2175674 RepID=UPI000DA94D1F|nr:SprT-like domain-containing protein [Curtobacterium sp. MCBD17_040]WIB65270.1 SprT-like domain-containing protein [Curtobacterium sp. MCBD17_040]
MDLTAARTLADNLIAEHLPAGWRFDFDRATVRLGQSNHRTKVITMSRSFTQAEEQPAVEQVLFHEVAHALAGANVGHGPVWLRHARRLGYTGRATVAAEATVEGAALIEQALAAMESVKDRTIGPLLMGEQVEFLGGKRGVFVEAKRVRAVLWSPSMKRLVRVKLDHIARVGQKSAGEERQERLEANAIAAHRRVAGRTGGPIAIGEHVGPARGYKPFAGLLIDIVPAKTRGGSRTAVIILDITEQRVHIPYPHIVRVPGPFQPKAGRPTPTVAAPSDDRAAAVTGNSIGLGDEVIVIKPRSKWHGQRGRVIKVNGATYKVQLALGLVLNASKDLVRKVS